MQVTFLGTADGHTSLTRNHSGLLIQTPETTLLLDCGAPVAKYLLRKKISPNLPQAIWISHGHSDHIGNFPDLIQSLWLRHRQAPLEIFASERLIYTLQEHLKTCLLFPELIGFPIQWHPIDAHSKLNHGPFHLKPFTTDHLLGLARIFKQGYPDTCFDCYGVVLDYKKHRTIYSSDLALPSDMEPVLDKPVRALICELTHFPEETLFKALAGFPIESLWITHYPDSLQGQEKRLKKVAKDCKFAGSIHMMHDGKTIQFKN